MARKRTFRRSKNRKRFSSRKKYNRKKIIKKRKSKKKKVNNQYAGVRPPSKFTRKQIIAPEETQTLDINTLISNGYAELATKTGKFIILNKNPN